MTVTIPEAEAHPAKEVTTSDVVYERAADLLEEFGWCQGYAAVNADECPVVPVSPSVVAFCAIGALTRAAADLNSAAGTKRLCDYLGLPQQGPANQPHPIAKWNDVSGRTRHEVVAALRGAART